MKIENVEITKYEIAPYLRSGHRLTLQEKIKALIDHQLTPVSGFPVLIKNMKQYMNSSFAYIKINNITYRIFFNPTRTKNVRANTFTDKTNNHKCLLCDLLPGQKGLRAIDGKYMIILNPGITIPGDLTIPTIRHELQILDNKFSDMLDLSRKLPDYSIYFNGPLAGATCPHFHFQAGIRDRLPLENSINQIIEKKPAERSNINCIYQSKETHIFHIPSFAPVTYACFTPSKDEAEKFMQHMLPALKELDKQYIHSIENIPDFGRVIKVFGQEESEARFNLMVKYYPKKKKYLTVIFPKLYNRPKIYFAAEKKRMILGFAIKEALGHILTSKREDLFRLLEDKEILRQSYSNTSITPVMRKQLSQKLKIAYKLKNPV